MDLTYEQIRAQQDAERAMHQWWILISERERQDTVKGIRGCLEYGCTVTVQRMPDAGKMAVQDAYAQHLKRVADLEAAHPSD
jgi:hypothetical protein